MGAKRRERPAEEGLQIMLAGLTRGADNCVPQGHRPDGFTPLAEAVF